MVYLSVVGSSGKVLEVQEASRKVVSEDHRRKKYGLQIGTNRDVDTPIMVLIDDCMCSRVSRESADHESISGI